MFSMNLTKVRTIISMQTSPLGLELAVDAPKPTAGVHEDAVLQVSDQTLPATVVVKPGMLHRSPK